MDMKKRRLTRANRASHLECVWSALEEYRDELIPEGDSDHDEVWDDICTAMAWLEEDHES